MAITKTLKSARPTVNVASGNVTRWDLEATFKDGDFERDYPYTFEVSGESKVPSAFTKAELIAAFPESLNEVFAHHKLVFSGDYTPETETVGDFDLDSLDEKK